MKYAFMTFACPELSLADALALGYADSLRGEWINWKPYDEFLSSELVTMKSYE